MESDDKKEIALHQEKNISLVLDRETLNQENSIEPIQDTFIIKIDQENSIADKIKSPESTFPSNLKPTQSDTSVNDKENSPIITIADIPNSPYPSDFSDYTEMDLENVPHISDYAAHLLSREEIKSNLCLDNITVSSQLHSLEAASKKLSWVKQHPYNFGLTSMELNEISTPINPKTKSIDDLKARKQKDSNKPYNKNKVASNHPSKPVNTSQNGIHSSNNSSPRASGTRPSWSNDLDDTAKRNFSFKKHHNSSSKYEPNNRYKPTNPKSKTFKPSKNSANKRPNDKELSSQKIKHPKKKNKIERDKNSERDNSKSKFDFDLLLESTAQSLDNEPSETNRRGSYVKTKEHNT